MWVLLEAGQQEGVRKSGRALTANVRKAELSALLEANLSALARVEFVLLCISHMPGIYLVDCGKAVYDRLGEALSYLQCRLIFAITRGGCSRLRLHRLQPGLQRSKHCC